MRQACSNFQPTDDQYSLGVALYRLLTRVYPPPGTDPEVLKEQGQELSPRRAPVLELNGRVVAALAALTERLLSKDPPARGTAREVAEAAEALAEQLGPEADVPLMDSRRPEAEALPARVVPVSGVQPALAEAAGRVPVHTEPQARSWPWRNALALATMSLAVVGPCWMAPEWSVRAPEGDRAEAPDAGMAPDAGTRGLGDDAMTTQVEAQAIHIASESISLEIPKKPLPGQRRPPCQRNWQVVINGGCWKHLTNSEPPCGDGEYEWQGACYDPAMDRSRPPTTKKQQ